MAQPPLLIIYQWTLRKVAFWLLHLLQVAGWLRLNPHVDIQSPKIFDLLYF
jgi:hypothetical protein